MRRIVALALLFFCAATAFARDDDDRVQFGRTIVVHEGQTIGGDAVCVACSIVNRGTIQGDAVTILGHIQNEGSIRGDTAVIIGHANLRGANGGEAAVVVGSLNIGSTGVVEKDASVTIGHLNVAPGGSVHGKIERSTVGGHAIALLFFVPLVFGLVIAIVLALICYLIAGQARIATVAATVQHQPGLSFLAGLGACVVFVVALSVFAHMHPISGLLVVAASIALTVALVVGYTGLSFAIGNRLRTSSPVAAIVIGAIVIAVGQSIPVLQIVIGFAAMMFALGATALTGFGTHPEWIQNRMGSGASTAPR